MGVPYSAATARNWLRKGGVTQRLCAEPSSRPLSHVPTHCSFSRAGSPAPPWVAGSPVAFLVATPWWPPAAALPVWTFCGAQYLGKAATLVPSRWSFARRLTLDTSLEQHVGRLGRDRTGRHWQRPVFAPEGYSGTPRQPTPCLLGHFAVRHFPAPSHREVRPGWDGGLSLGPLPSRTARRRHLRIAPTAQYRRKCARRLGLVKPRDPSWCPVTPSFGGPPAAGRQQVFSWVARSRVVKSHLGGPDVVCHCGGTRDRGLFAPQSSCPGSSRRQGSHLPCTSVGLLR